MPWYSRAGYARSNGTRTHTFYLGRKNEKRHTRRLKGDILSLEGQNSLLSGDLFHQDEDIRYLRWKLAEAEVEIVRLNVLPEGQSKRKY
jgi:hypothetical protein